MNPTIDTFWTAYLNSLPEGTPLPPKGYEAWGFGRTPELASRLGALVVQGTKTATTSLFWCYEAENEPLPEPGDLSLIIDGNGEPLCIIETTEIVVKPFNEVDASFAWDEGEGDRSLAYWRGVHWEVFAEDCADLGREPEETMLVVCERFRKLYPPTTPPARG